MHGTIDLERTIETADDQFPALFQLFGGYFHQDWREEYTSADDALAAFKNEAPIGALHDALVEIDEVMSLQLDDPDLGRLLTDGLASNYMPHTDGLSNTQWFVHLRNVLLPSTSPQGN